MAPASGFTSRSSHGRGFPTAHAVAASDGHAIATRAPTNESAASAAASCAESPAHGCGGACDGAHARGNAVLHVTRLKLNLS